MHLLACGSDLLPALQPQPEPDECASDEFRNRPAVHSIGRASVDTRRPKRPFDLRLLQRVCLPLFPLKRDRPEFTIDLEPIISR
jgi:hypothetical protein